MEASSNFVQVVEMTPEEKFEMYIVNFDKFTKI